MVTASCRRSAGEQHQIRDPQPELHARLFSVVRDHGVESRLLQAVLEHLDDVPLVVDDQDLLARHVSAQYPTQVTLT
jgi:hypothetical protein